jgi:hypothetical protein
LSEVTRVVGGTHVNSHNYLITKPPNPDPITRSGQLATLDRRLSEEEITGPSGWTVGIYKMIGEDQESEDWPTVAEQDFTAYTDDVLRVVDKAIRLMAGDYGGLVERDPHWHDAPTIGADIPRSPLPSLPAWLMGREFHTGKGIAKFLGVSRAKLYGYLGETVRLTPMR